MIRLDEFRKRVLDAAEELTGITYLKKDGELMVDAVFLAIEKALSEGEDIEIRGFGKFRIHNYPERKVTQKDGKVYIVPPVAGVKFVPGNRLKREVAQGIIRPVE